VNFSTQQFNQKFGSAELTEFGADWSFTLGLFFGGSPSKIFRSIIFISVDSISCMIRWTLTDISQKIFKFIPTVTYFYAATAIINVARRVWIVTSRAHSFPSCVKRMFVFLCSIPVSKSAVCFGHRTVPFSSRSSDGIGVTASIPLRIVAHPGGGFDAYCLE